MMIEKLTDYIEGRLSPAAAAQVEMLLTNDADARATFAWLTQFHNWREQVQLPAPNPAIIDGLVAKHAKKFAPAPQPSLWQRVTAVLSVDSWGLQGARSADFTQSRQLAFTTETLDLILDITPQQINGQVLPKLDELPPDFTIQLLRGDDNAALTHSDDLGEFTLAAPSGEYQLVLCNDTLEVWLPPLHIA
jgi:hypothetical protein